MPLDSMFGHNSLAMAVATSNTNTDTNPSSSHSSPGEFEVEDDANILGAQWQHGQSPLDQASQHPRTPAPHQKRRRVTRACDECRRKKIKCDGKQPCTHCTVYSYDCTYDQPSNRRRNPAPQYIEALETRLQRTETLLRSALPNVDLNDANIDALIQKRLQAGNGEEIQTNQAETSGKKSDESDHEAQLRSMIESTGQLDLDESGHWDFYGGSSGIVFVKRMREQFDDLLGGYDHRGPILPRLSRPVVPSIDSPRSMTESPMEGGLPNTVDLPSRETAKTLCEDSLDGGCSLLRFVHYPSFYEMFDKIYDTPPDQFGDNENRFLPLLYMVLALGCLSHNEPSRAPKGGPQNTYKNGIELGLKYYRAARSMVEPTDCRDLTSLQAVIFMTLFLQASSNLGTCYAYIGVALRSGLRMGLHRSLAGNFNPIERETRRRVFWVIRKMDTYVSALLGLPQMLSSDDIDQELPIEVEDEYITKDGVIDMPPGKFSPLIAASNAHTRLMSILAKVVKYIYPTKGLEQSLQRSTKSSYVIGHAKIREIERDLAHWLDKLPMVLRPGGEGPPEVLRMQQLLRLSYAHCQMMLYRPFLHYVSSSAYVGKTIDERSYACAAACISVSRNVVHITMEMERRGLLVGAYWFAMYTTFFAIISLVYFVLENPDKAGSREILADANDGKDALDDLAKGSQAADRCSTALGGLFEKLPETLKGSKVPKQQKKRSAPEFSLTAQRNLHSCPEHPDPALSMSRATIFPMKAPAQPGTLPGTSLDLDGDSFQTNTSSSPNLGQSFHELVSPSSTDMSPINTPRSNTIGTMSPPQYSMHSQIGLSTAVPDFSAMMFPSNDPFAYPNQPMMPFDNIKQEGMGNMANGTQVLPINLANGHSREYDDLQGQLFGPLPQYLSQTQQVFGMQGSMGGENMMGQNLNYATGVQPGDDGMAFDGIFCGQAGDDAWASSS